ncbi:MAG: EamA family transporter [Deltaproteobacteria bacterium]|nr:MAG: EamA family transporter [Deltaproteobacteria bacterium]
MYLGEIFAILAALCWSCTGLISVGPARALGPVAFNRLRMVLTTGMLFGMSLYTEAIYVIDVNAVCWLALSAVIGISLGDTALFVTISRLGPRRTGVLFTLSAPLTALLGYLFLGERLSLINVVGCVVTVAGVMIAVYFGGKRRQVHSWEATHGSVLVGVAYGFLAALFQAIGAVIAKPVLASGVDPLAAATLRTGTAAVLLVCTLFSKKDIFHAKIPLNFSVVGRTALSGMIGMALGMTLLLYAIAHGSIGIVATLSSLSPVLTLPLLWIFTKQCPGLGAWIGAVIAVAGAALLFL